ncbi:MAG: hypothetical protein L0K86_04395, partial [Actinomycetia bacterium]|nr:hypothetical protein [Actinomycetes bacterium]
MKIVLAAEEAAGMRTLQLVLGSSHQLHAVLASAPGSGTTGSVAAAADRADVPRLDPSLVSDPGFADALAQAGVDVLLNVHSLRIVAPPVLAAPRFGCFNLHPGPLPRYAGMNAPSWAVYHGERQHAVTLHWMTATIDAGPIAYSSSVEISERDTGLSVSATCARRGAQLVARLLDHLANDPRKVPSADQNLSERRYFGPGVPHDGWIRWSSAAREIVNFARACDFGPFPSPWGRPRLRAADGTPLTAGRVTASAQPGEGAAPGTGRARAAAAPAPPPPPPP